jgi:hypothetical protein
MFNEAVRDPNFAARFELWADDGDLFAKILLDSLPVPSEVDPVCTAEFDRFWRKAAARNPDYRFPNAPELAQALGRALGILETPLSVRDTLRSRGCEAPLRHAGAPLERFLAGALVSSSCSGRESRWKRRASLAHSPSPADLRILEQRTEAVVLRGLPAKEGLQLGGHRPVGGFIAIVVLEEPRVSKAHDIVSFVHRSSVDRIFLRFFQDAFQREPSIAASSSRVPLGAAEPGGGTGAAHEMLEQPESRRFSDRRQRPVTTHRSAPPGGGGRGCRHERKLWTDGFEGSR